MTHQQIARRERCRPCRFFHRCKIHWGDECNRRGGKKIPRFRNLPDIEAFQITGLQEPVWVYWKPWDNTNPTYYNP
ncbi:MAG: hypothetical protein AB1523_09710 [Bacillota bacterium]